MSKFNVGDRVRILRLDDMSSAGMIEYIGQIGVVKTVDEEESEISYGISFESENHDVRWWFEESSLKFEGRKFLVNLDEVFHIVINARKKYPEARNILDEIIYKIGGLPCK